MELTVPLTIDIEKPVGFAFPYVQFDGCAGAEVAQLAGMVPFVVALKNWHTGTTTAANAVRLLVFWFHNSRV